MKTNYSKIRVGLIVIAFAMIFTLFFARLVFIQLVNGEDYRKVAQRQYSQSKKVPAERGIIYDAKGREVAVNATFRSLCVYPLNGQDVKE
jgi:cell division protein FtsI/penicillin-binding protein 2